MSWPFVKLGDICDLQNGFAFKSSHYVDDSNTLSCRMSNIRPGGEFDIEYNARYLPDEFTDKYKQFLLKDGDVIIAMTDLADSPKILGVPTVVITGGKNILLNQRVGKLIIKDHERVYFPYLKLALNYPKVRSIYKQFAGGGLQINLGKNDLLSVEVPLPPLPEQKRIAAILDKADQLRQKRQQAIALADEFLRSVFLDMFGDPVTNPKGWEVEPLAKSIDNIVGGWSANGENQPAREGQLGVLKISSVTSGRFLPSENKVIDASSVGSRNLVFPQKGDLLFSRANTRELVAATVIVDAAHDNIFLPDKLWNIRFNKTSMLPEFFHYLLMHPRMKDRITSQATGTSGSMLNISKKKLIETEAILPPIEKQRVFSSIYWAVGQTNKTLSESAVYTQELFNSISQKAFAGLL